MALEAKLERQLTSHQVPADESQDNATGNEDSKIGESQDESINKVSPEMNELANIEENSQFLNKRKSI